MNTGVKRSGNSQGSQIGNQQGNRGYATKDIQSNKFSAQASYYDRSRGPPKTEKESQQETTRLGALCLCVTETLKDPNSQTSNLVRGPTEGVTPNQEEAHVRGREQVGQKRGSKSRETVRLPIHRGGQERSCINEGLGQGEHGLPQDAITEKSSPGASKRSDITKTNDQPPPQEEIGSQPPKGSKSDERGRNGTIIPNRTNREDPTQSQ
ncbi:hypothetical protein C922_05420 [Plasmodium inui San Antonio 1]|uniref:Uncharacterized protein n=1 Tax=Plasmodium inui San Antonio 1 TaxID=1237626 RepID=W7AFX9_9APIC|nr:hypothetical protein C922_05420 [Plasmodium inui San Antonio 1]EUD64196.1 hypothetical protein C922_05420 [Plasmodium inui San Antonio 1]